MPRIHGVIHKGAAPVRKKAATCDIVLGMVGGKGRSLRELRDRAILLLGFAGAFRRSELVALNVEDIEETPEGMLVMLRRSKTDQEGLGQVVAITYGTREKTCPVRALKAWLALSQICDGPLFRRLTGIDLTRCPRCRRGTMIATPLPPRAPFAHDRAPPMPAVA